MPNHVANKLSIKAKAKRIKEIRDAISGKYEDGTDMFIDFNKIVPMPEELNHVTSPPCVVTGKARAKQLKELEQWLNSKTKNTLNKPRVDLTEELAIEYQKKFGATNWYDWTRENWGTKWNAYSQRNITGKTIYFKTAWNHPEMILTKLSTMFPDVIFECSYADEDTGSNCGIMVYENGIVEDITPFEERSGEAKKFARRLFNR